MEKFEIKDAGSVSYKVAKQLAENELEKFRVLQDRQFKSDFDRLAKKLGTHKDDKKQDK